MGRKKSVEKKIVRKLDHAIFDYEISYSKFPHHAAIISKEASEKGFDIVIAVGGDGSANDVARGLVNTNTIMGIIPVGSGNGLAHHLKIPTKISKAIETLNNFNISRIDTATINGQLFISIAGLGFDAHIAEKFALYKTRGFWTYFLLTISEFFKYIPLEYNIRYDGKEIKREALLLSFANTGQFGYNATISSTASVNDGFIDLCIIRKISAFRTATIAHRLFIKDIDSSKYVEVYKAKEVTIDCKSFASSHIDGDPCERIMKAHIKIQPKTLNIIVP